MKLGSSRGMDTKPPPRSESSKPRHELRLTRPSQPPYPWPPEQAQPGVSKPCRTTRRTNHEPWLGELPRLQLSGLAPGERVQMADDLLRDSLSAQSRRKERAF